MQRRNGFALHKLLVALLLCFAAGSVATWYLTRDVLPSEVCFATASKGGLYHRFGGAFAPFLKKRVNRPLKLVDTEGTLANSKLLLEGKVNLAIMQSGAADTIGILAVAPLYREAALIVVRRSSKITNLGELEGRTVSIGPDGSGMRLSALDILNHYGVDPSTFKNSEKYFLSLLTDKSMDAAIVTSGLLNPDLVQLLRTGDFQLLPVGEAVTVWHPYFEKFSIPRGLYSENPPVPATATDTIAATAYLAVRADASNAFVHKTLQAFHQDFPTYTFPMIIPPDSLKNWRQVPLHPAAHNYHDPYKGIDLLANFMESLAAIKELLFAFGAGAYLLWARRKRKREETRAAELSRQKEALDELLQQTVQIEKAQMGEQTEESLQELLDQVTRIKLKALDELADEQLLGDRLFSIFLMQCANLIRKIQGKLTMKKIR